MLLSVMLILAVAVFNATPCILFALVITWIPDIILLLLIYDLLQRW